MNPQEIEIKAYCKINIALDIKHLRKDGYHEVEMILQTIPLCDIVTLRCKDGPPSVRLESNAAWMPTDEKNTAYKAALVLMRDYSGKINGCTEIFVDKRIPACGGLGGSSTDAAAVLNGMNLLYDLQIPYEQLCRYAAKIGADVPFLLRPGAAIASGTGTDLRYIEPLQEGILLLVNPNIEICTPESYHTYDILNGQNRIPQEEHPDIPAAATAMRAGVSALPGKMKNVLEYPAFYLHPELRELKESIRAFGAAEVMMSGSGATFFGIFRSQDALQAQNAAAYFKEKGYFTFVNDKICL